MNDLNHSTAGDDGADLTGFSDEELAAAAGAGDAEAFEQLMTRSAPVVLRFIRRLVDDQQVAEDLAQDTMLAMWRGLPDFAFRSKVRTWLLGIAHRRVADYYRRRREIPAAGEQFADLASVEPLPSDEAERSELVDALRAELRRLPTQARAVWWLREVDGLSLTEIGQVTGLSNGSVRGHLQRTRAYLSTRLAPWKPGAGAAPAADTGTTPEPPVPRRTAGRRAESGPAGPGPPPRTGLDDPRRRPGVHVDEPQQDAGRRTRE